MRVVQFVAHAILEAPMGVWLESTFVNRALESLQPLSIRGALPVGGFRPHDGRRVAPNLSNRTAADWQGPPFGNQQFSFAT